jgi:hypothetical protein
VDEPGLEPETAALLAEVERLLADGQGDLIHGGVA